MEPLTWTGSLGPVLNPVMLVAVSALIVTTLASIILSVFSGEDKWIVNADHTLTVVPSPAGWAKRLALWSLLAVIGVALAYLIGGILVADDAKGIFGRMATQFLPVWISLLVLFGLSITFKRRLGLYGHLFDNTIGMIGLGLVMFWVFTAIFADMIITFDPVQDVISGMKNKGPGTPLGSPDDGQYPYYLLGGDALARDVFSRMVMGARVVLLIAPLASLFAFMVGITLGVPAGYLGGIFDTVLSFIANLVLAFPVILLFFLLVTPEITQAGIPSFMAAVLFIFPIIFLLVLFNAKLHTKPQRRIWVLGIIGIVTGWLYLSLISQPRTPVHFLPDAIDLFDVPIGILIVFVSVVFVNSPTVFRIVRGLTLDTRARDYVAAAQTRGEGPWYIMLWEILPNARGPLLVDFCLRIGYTTILLGTLGFFGLGLPPESPDWGTSINAGRGLLQFFPFPPLVPAVAIMSLVLGLNLLADGLREESLKD